MKAPSTGNWELSTVLSLKLGGSQNIALRGSTAARNCACLIFYLPRSFNFVLFEMTCMITVNLAFHVTAGVSPSYDLYSCLGIKYHLPTSIQCSISGKIYICLFQIQHACVAQLVKSTFVTVCFRSNVSLWTIW